MKRYQSAAKLRQAIMSDYAKSVKLPTAPRYYGGAPLRPVVPLDCAQGGVMIVGAYPSARFATVGKMRNVPVGDNLGPFEPERYFDGERVRTQDSADELAAEYLAPLGLSRKDCWITDLVKVFLFKKGHAEKYEALKTKVPRGYIRESFEKIAGDSLDRLNDEVAFAQPKLVITLGAEVAGIIGRVKPQAARNRLLNGTINKVLYGKLPVPTVHMAHPGIVMRPGNRNPWPSWHRDEHVPKVKGWLQERGISE